MFSCKGAEADIQTAFESYGGPETERADRFLQRLDKIFALLRENPAMGPVYGKPFRQLLLHGFRHAMFLHGGRAADLCRDGAGPAAGTGAHPAAVGFAVIHVLRL